MLLPIAFIRVVLIWSPFLHHFLLPIIVEFLPWRTFHLSDSWSVPWSWVDALNSIRCLLFVCHTAQFCDVTSPCSIVFISGSIWVSYDHFRSFLGVGLPMLAYNVLERWVFIGISSGIGGFFWDISLTGCKGSPRSIGLNIAAWWLISSIGLVGGGSRQYSWRSLIDIANIVEPTFWSTWIIVDEGWINGLELGISLNTDALISQDYSALTLCSFKINIFRIMNYLFFDWDILIALDLLLYLHHFNLFLRNYLFFVLDYLLNRHIFSPSDLSRHWLHDPALLHSRFFLLYWNFLNNLLVFILNHLLLVRHVVYSALSYIQMFVPLTTDSFFTLDEEKVLAYVLTLEAEGTPLSVLLK